MLELILAALAFVVTHVAQFVFLAALIVGSVFYVVWVNRKNRLARAELVKGTVAE